MTAGLDRLEDANAPAMDRRWRAAVPPSESHTAEAEIMAPVRSAVDPHRSFGSAMAPCVHGSAPAPPRIGSRSFLAVLSNLPQPCVYEQCDRFLLT